MGVWIFLGWKATRTLWFVCLIYSDIWDFELLEKKNVFPSSIIQKDLIFFPIEVDEEKNEIFLFSESQLFKNWNFKKEKYHQLNYILPNEDIDDYNLIKKVFLNF